MTHLLATRPHTDISLLLEHTDKPDREPTPFLAHEILGELFTYVKLARCTGISYPVDWLRLPMITKKKIQNICYPVIT